MICIMSTETLYGNILLERKEMESNIKLEFLQLNLLSACSNSNSFFKKVIKKNYI